MKRLFLLITLLSVIAAIGLAGDWKEYKGSITDEGTTYQWFNTPDFVNGIAVYLDITSTPTDANWMDTLWVTLWTQYQNVMGDDNAAPNIDSVTALLTAKKDTCMVLTFFDADSLQAGPNAKYRWGPRMRLTFVARDTVTTADSTFDVPIRWRATIGGF
jgi:hypothetical protein